MLVVAKIAREIRGQGSESYATDDSHEFERALLEFIVANPSLTPDQIVNSKEVQNLIGQHRDRLTRIGVIENTAA